MLVTDPTRLRIREDCFERVGWAYFPHGSVGQLLGLNGETAYFGESAAYTIQNVRLRNTLSCVREGWPNLEEKAAEDFPGREGGIIPGSARTKRFKGEVQGGMELVAMLREWKSYLPWVVHLLYYRVVPVPGGGGQSAGELQQCPRVLRELPPPVQHGGGDARDPPLGMGDGWTGPGCRGPDPVHAPLHRAPPPARRDAGVQSAAGRSLHLAVLHGV